MKKMRYVQGVRCIFFFVFYFFIFFCFGGFRLFYFMAKQPIPDTSPLIFSNKPHASYDALIAIPSCNEFPNIKDVFSSLEANDPKLLEKTLLVINVNNRTKSPSVNNTRTIEWLKSYSGRLQTAH